MSAASGGGFHSTTAGATGTATGGVDPVSSGTFSGGGTGASGVGGVGVPSQPAVPTFSAETEVSQAAGQQGSAVLRGGGAGGVEGQLGGEGTAGAAEGTVAQARAGQSTVSDARFAAGAAAASPASAGVSGFARAENLEFHQRDQVMARSQEVDDMHAQAVQTIDDPTAVGTERAEMEGSQHLAAASPIDPHRVQDQAGVAAGAVADPQGTARAQAEGAVSTQQREAEVKAGIRGSAGPSREEITGTPTGLDDKKK